MLIINFSMCFAVAHQCSTNHTYKNTYILARAIHISKCLYQNNAKAKMCVFRCDQTVLLYRYMIVVFFFSILTILIHVCCIQGKRRNMKADSSVNIAVHNKRSRNLEIFGRLLIRRKRSKREET